MTKPKTLAAMLTLSLLSPPLQAGSIVYRSAYSKETVAQGMGKTIQDAAKDALCSLPHGWDIKKLCDKRK